MNVKFQSLWTQRWRAISRYVDLQCKLWNRLFGLSYQDRILARLYDYEAHACRIEMRKLVVTDARQRIRKVA